MNTSSGTRGRCPKQDCNAKVTKRNLNKHLKEHEQKEFQTLYDNKIQARKRTLAEAPSVTKRQRVVATSQSSFDHLEQQTEEQYDLSVNYGGDNITDFADLNSECDFECNQNGQPIEQNTQVEHITTNIGAIAATTVELNAKFYEVQAIRQVEIVTRATIQSKKDQTGLFFAA